MLACRERGGAWVRRGFERRPLFGDLGPHILRVGLTFGSDLIRLPDAFRLAGPEGDRVGDLGSGILSDLACCSKTSQSEF